MSTYAPAQTARTASTFPRWVLFFGIFLTLVGLMATVQYYLTPAAMYPHLPLDLADAQAASGAVAARSLAQAIALGLALFFRNRQAAGILFLMRALTEGQDLLLSLSTGIAPMPTAALIPAFGVLIGAELYAAYTLLARRAD